MTTPDFSDLTPHIETWGLETRSERVNKHLTSSFEEIKVFHDAIAPRVEEILVFLDQFPVDAIPDEHIKLSYALLALAEIDASVNSWKSAILPYMADPRLWTLKSSFYDNGQPEAKTGKLLPQENA